MSTDFRLPFNLLHDQRGEIRGHRRSFGQVLNNLRQRPLGVTIRRGLGMGREKLLQFSRFGFGQPGAPKKFTESLGCCVVHSIISLWIKTSWGEKLLSFGLLVPFSSSEVRLELLF